MSDVKFVKGNITQYNNLSEKDEGTLYYIDNNGTDIKAQEVYLGTKKVSSMSNLVDADSIIIHGSFEQTYVQYQDTNRYSCVVIFTPDVAIASFTSRTLLYGYMSEPYPLPSGGSLTGGITELKVQTTTGLVRYGLRGMDTSAYIPNRYYLFGIWDSVIIDYMSVSQSGACPRYSAYDNPVQFRTTDVIPTIGLDSATYNIGGWDRYCKDGVLIITFEHGNHGSATTYLGHYTSVTGGTIQLTVRGGSWNDGDTVIFICVDTDLVGGVYIYYYDAVVACASSAKSGMVRTTGSIPNLTNNYVIGGVNAKTTFESLFTAHPWTASTSYVVGDMVYYSRGINYGTTLYVCNTDNTDTRWTSSHWTKVNFEGLYNSTKLASTLKSGTVQFANILAEGSASTSVTLSPAASSADYQVVATAESTDVVVGITFKDASGFTISVRNLTESPILTLKVSYIVLNT